MTRPNASLDLEPAQLGASLTVAGHYDNLLAYIEDLEGQNMLLEAKLDRIVEREARATRILNAFRALLLGRV